MTTNQIATRRSLILLILGALSLPLRAFCRPLLASAVCASITFPQHKGISHFVVQRNQIAPNAFCSLILHLVDESPGRVHKL